MDKNAVFGRFAEFRRMAENAALLVDDVSAQATLKENQSACFLLEHRLNVLVLSRRVELEM